MGCLSHLVDPRFLRPLALALSSDPLSELELNNIFSREVPNRNLSKRSLGKLMELSQRGGLIAFEKGTWRTVLRRDIDRAVSSCLEVWIQPGFTDDDLLRNRSKVLLGQGLISANYEYAAIGELANRSSLAPAEWARLISGPCDLRQLTGLGSKHSEAEFLMICRSMETVPFTDDLDVSPRVPLSLLPSLPASADDLLSGILRARAYWQKSLEAFFGDVAIKDFDGFIIYAKDMLDYLFWGASSPLKSMVSPDRLAQVSQMLQSFGLRAEELSTVWRGLPSAYRLISRLSWGIRYLSNNISHPSPAGPDAKAFLRICELSASRQSAISAARSGHSLVSLIRPLRVLRRALENWPGHEVIAASAEECARAISADALNDKLFRREFADRIRRLNVIGSLQIMDAFADKVVAPVFPKSCDAALSSAGLIAAYSQFLESPRGRAYAEVRLALHAALDFQRRFNVHSLTAPRRYEGVWRDSLQQLVERLEDTRRAFIPA